MSRLPPDDYNYPNSVVQDLHDKLDAAAKRAEVAEAEVERQRQEIELFKRARDKREAEHFEFFKNWAGKEMAMELVAERARAEKLEAVIEEARLKMAVQEAHIAEIMEDHHKLLARLPGEEPLDE